MRARQMLGLLTIVMVVAFHPLKADDLFTDEDGILTVRNATGVDFVLFAGRVENEILLGGVRANSSRSFDIAKIRNMPEEGVFILRGVLAETYLQKAGSITESDVLYRGLVVYDLQDTGNITKIIPNEIDETMSFVLISSNYSQSICELRLDTPDGPAITVLPARGRYFPVWIKPSEFGMPSVIWPVFISVGPDGTIHESVPSSYDSVRFDPAPREGERRIIEFNNRTDEGERINLLFE